MRLMFNQFWDAIPFLMKLANFAVVILSVYSIYRIIRLLVTGDNETYEVKYRIIMVLVGVIGKLIEDSLLRINADSSFLLIPFTAVFHALIEPNLSPETMWKLTYTTIPAIFDLMVAIPFAIFEVKAYKERKEI